MALDGQAKDLLLTDEEEQFGDMGLVAVLAGLWDMAAGSCRSEEGKKQCADVGF